MFEPLRLVTVHPALVHVPVGSILFLVVAFVMARLRRSEAWAFAGDAALVVTAAVTVVAAGFGLVSNAVLAWPGGLDSWRWLHLGFGVASTVMLVAFAIARMRMRTRGRPSGTGSLAAAVVIAALVGTTGWLGGEVLVFHAGMAVKGAADGALAPPVSGRDAREPRTLLEAMESTRPRWAAAVTDVSRMIAVEPSDERFTRVARQAGELRRLAARIGEGNLAVQLPLESGRAAVDASALAAMGSLLEQRAEELERAATQKDLAATAQAVGRLDATCAGCHLGQRWRPAAPSVARSK